MTSRRYSDKIGDMDSIYAEGGMSTIAREFDRSRRNSWARHNEHVLRDERRRARRRRIEVALGGGTLAALAYFLIVLFSVALS